MRKINFRQVQVYTGIARKSCIVQDISEVFADAIYTNCIGIKAHSLALKIYNAQGEAEYDDEEVALIRKCAESLASPSLIDSINELIEEGGNQ